MLYKLQIISGNMYKIKRKIRIGHNPIVDTWKEHLHCDKVFQNNKDGYYYFCESIPDLEIIKDVIS
jgi:hypothetical protein